MRKIFNQLLDAIREFVRQRDDLLLLVPCADGDVALLMKALRDVDRESAADVYLLFAEDFSAADDFLDRVAARLQEEHALASEAVPGAAPLPELPAEFVDDRHAAPLRLEAGMRYAHSLIDSRQGQHVVWGMGPGRIDDAGGYLQLLAHLLPRPGIRPWMRGARIVARVPAEFRLEATPLADARRVRVLPFSIPSDVHEAELRETADDANLPMGDRMQAEVQLAYLDYAHGRFGSAIERFLKALAFFQWAEVPVMEGLIICGLGDIARRQQNLTEARHWFECAAVPASRDGNPMLMSAIVQNLAAIDFQEQRFADAEQRYGELITLKRAMLDEDGLAEALEWQGLSQERQAAHDRAIECWYEGALICKSFEMHERLPRVLGHLKRGYVGLGMHEALERFDAEWGV